MHDYYVNSLGTYFRFSWVRYNSCIRCVISTTIYAARQGEPQLWSKAKGSMAIWCQYKSTTNRATAGANLLSQIEKVTIIQSEVPFQRPTINLCHSLGIFSRRQIDDIFLIFPRKQDLTFHANCLLRRQYAWNVKSCFLGKLRKYFQNVVCWKFYPEC